MKYPSTAFIAVALFAATSAVHAQTADFGTTFDGSTTYPYTDPTVYSSTFGDLNGTGEWTATPLYAVTTYDSTGTNTVAQVYSGNGTATASHALTFPTGAGYTFNTDFSIAANNAGMGGADSAGNAFSFSLTNSLGTAFAINFAPTGTTGGVENAFQPQLVIGGVAVATAAQGPIPSTPTMAEPYHLTISVSTVGVITASLGTPDSTITYSDPAAAAAITGFAVSEVDQSTLTGYDYVAFDNISVVVPEPSTYAMIGMGFLGMLGLMRFRRA